MQAGLEEKPLYMFDLLSQPVLKIKQIIYLSCICVYLPTYMDHAACRFWITCGEPLQELQCYSFCTSSLCTWNNEVGELTGHQLC